MSAMSKKMSRPVRVILAVVVLALSFLVFGDGPLFWLITIGAVTMFVISEHAQPRA